MVALALEVEVKKLEPRVILIPPRIVEKALIFKSDSPIFHNPLGGPPCQGDFLWVDLSELAAVSKAIDYPLEPPDASFDKALLLARVDVDIFSPKDLNSASLEYWQRLFKARVKLTFMELREKGECSPGQLEERIEAIGRIAFEEALLVLSEEKKLSGEEPLFNQYMEFTAEFLALYHFSENLLGNYFPAIRDIEAALAVMRKDIPDLAIFQQTRLEKAPDPQPTPETHSEESNEYFQRLSQQARKESIGHNQVGAAILWTQANRIAPAEFSAETMAQAHGEIRILVGRLQKALDFDPSKISQWESALFPLLSKADQGSNTAEARLLRELQLACEDHEQEIFRLDLSGWVFSLGKKPLQRPLPFQRQLNIHHRLRAAGLRSTSTRLSFTDRKNLENLILAIGRDHENRVRDTIRPLLIDCLGQAGLLGEGAQGEIARRRLVEEIIDRVLDRGFLDYSDLRDMVSRNHLKMEDIASPLALLKGDSLLHLDRLLGIRLDGVYRRSDCYLRWLEKLTALNFGTATGRLITRYLTLPFGGAFLVVEALDIICEKAIQVRPPAALRAESFLFLGILLFGLINIRWIRGAATGISKAFYSVFKFFLFEIPKAVVFWPPLLLMLRSYPAQWVYSYLLKPLVFAEAIAIWLPVYFPKYFTDAALFLVFTFFLNTPLGRFLTEMLLRCVKELSQLIKEGLIVILFKLALEIFRKIIQGLEYLLRRVDDWLRLKGHPTAWKVVARGALTILWAPIAFFIRFYLVVLVEPGINPIKFPVSSVAAKFVYPVALPLHPALVSFLSPFIGDVAANLIIGSTLWLLPDAFGFLFWETKENWGLYRANRPTSLRPVMVGSYGETVGQLLRPGFYSGTIPRLFHRLRVTEKKAIQENDWRHARTLRLELQSLKDRLARFVERDFLNPMQQNNKAFPNPFRVKEIQLGLNRVQVVLSGLEGEGCASFSLCFEYSQGWILGSVSNPTGDWGLNQMQQRSLNLGVAGLFKFAGVELSMEQISNGLPGWAKKWEFAKEGFALINFQSEKNGYSFDRGKGVLSLEEIENSPRQTPELNWSRSLFYLHPVAWKDWAKGWDRAAMDLEVEPLNFAGVEPDLLGLASHSITEFNHQESNGQGIAQAQNKQLLTA